MKPADSRLDGIYKQRQEGYFMQRVKLPVGAISADQVLLLCRLAEQHGRGRFHLTTRGNIEIHWVKEDDLPAVKRQMTLAGLTSRGACGGAVRGVTCSSQSAAAFPQIEVLARQLQRHFTGSTRFERLPKKFKIGIEPDTSTKRHLIQDVGLVQVKFEDGRVWYDLYLAGGLGREPQPGYLFESSLPQERLIPLIEAILNVYTAHTPVGKRLKFLIREIGRERFRELVYAEPSAGQEIPVYNGISENIFDGGNSGRVEVPVFAGDLSSKQFRKIAKIVQKHGTGALMVTADQNLAFETAEPVLALEALEAAGFLNANAEEKVNFRVCPGNHECLMGLTATRDVARKVLRVMGPNAQSVTWAISGCSNSCSQPQLADYGIVVCKLVSDVNSQKTPRFDLYQQQPGGLGQRIRETLTLDELQQAVAELG